MPPVNTPPKQTTAPFTNENVVNTKSSGGPPVQSFVGDTGVETDELSGVQKQAIKHILELNDMEYEGLAKLALKEDNVPELDKLKYSQAIKVIQYGNNLSSAT
jgi:hypothetical protein